MDDVVERPGGEITPLDITDAVSTKCLENAEKDDGGRVVNGGIIHGLQVALQFKQWEADALCFDITRLSADLEEARRVHFELAAQIADECDICMGMIAGGPDGASIARRQISAAIRKEGERTC